MEYLGQILTPHGGALVLLMLASTACMGRIFSLIADLRRQAVAIDELVPHLRAALSSGNAAKAAVAAESDESCIGRLMAAVLREPTNDTERMRLIYKLNIDDELRVRLRCLSPLKGWAVVALVLGAAGAITAWGVTAEETIALKRALVVGISGLVVFLYGLFFFITIRRREVEMNDTLAAEALNLIDTASRASRENIAV